MKTTIPDSNSATIRSRQRRLHGKAATRGFVLAMLLLGTCPAFCATATFVQRDTMTQGTWITIPTGAKIYGSDGYLMWGNNVAISALPGYVSSIAYAGIQTYVWRDPSTTNPVRDLQLPVAPYTTRIAAGWYGHPSSTMVVNVTDTAPHLMAVYCVDSDATDRRQTLQILDGISDDVLDSQALTTQFDQGVWLQWIITGSVKIKVILDGGPNTALMGFFFDPVPPVAYANWLTRYSFAAGANKMPGGDPDRDGMSNQQEFAFGLNPTLGSPVNPIIMPLAGLATGKFSYTRLATSGLTYTVHTSTDLLTWPAAAATQSVIETVDGIETVEVTLTEPPPVGGRLFVRVQAQ